MWKEEDSMTTTRPTLSPTKLSLPSKSKATNSSVGNETQMRERPIKTDFELMGRPVVNDPNTFYADDTFILADAISAARITMQGHPSTMVTTVLMILVVLI